MRHLSIAVIAAASTVAFTQIASAADMPVKAPALPVAVPHSWTGFYAGANLGGGWGDRDVSFSPNDPLAVLLFNPTTGGAPPPISLRTSGVLGGLQLGYNRQLNRNWLLGAETDFNWSGVKGSGSSSGVVTAGGTVSFAETVDEKIKWFGTVRARLGYLPTDNLLAFVTGGFAYGKVDRSANYTFGAGPVIGSSPGFSFLCPVGGAACLSGSSSHVATGWTLGGGLEYAVWQRWTLKAEYLYVSLDSKSVTEIALSFAPGNLPSSFNANYNRTNFNVARVGVNYRF